MLSDRDELVQRLCNSLVKAVELRMETKDISDQTDFSADNQAYIDAALASSVNVQVQLINAITVS